MPTILVVDDEPYIRLLIRETLSIDPRFSFQEAEDGLAAIAAVRAACPDLIILDIMMPKMDGLEVCRRLKSDPTLCATPIILVTAYAAGYEAAGREAGADGFIKKPFIEEELISRVTELLQSRGK